MLSCFMLAALVTATDTSAFRHPPRPCVARRVRQSCGGVVGAANPPPDRHLDLRTLKHCVFLVFCDDSAQNMHGAAAQLTAPVIAPPAAETLNMHETRATAAFALSLPRPTWKCLLFLVLCSMSGLRCAGLLYLLSTLLAPTAAAEWAKPYG